MSAYATVTRCPGDRHSTVRAILTTQKTPGHRSILGVVRDALTVECGVE